MSYETNMPPDETTCRDVAQFLMAYVDGELSASTQRAFENHLAQCSSCVRYLDHYRRTVALAQASGQDITSIEAPPSVIRAIREARMHAG